MFWTKSKKTNMELEIAEQSKIIPYILMRYIQPSNGEIKLELPQNIRKIILVASGSSYHCARFAVDLLEKFSGIESRAIYSSEFLLKSVIPHDENTLYIFITQSGETSDTIKSVQKVKETSDLATLCITNNEESTIWNMCDYRVACYAGIEQGIAATKSFTAIAACLPTRRRQRRAVTTHTPTSATDSPNTVENTPSRSLRSSWRPSPTR